MQDGFVGVAARSPQVRVADVDFNVDACLHEATDAAKFDGARVVVRGVRNTADLDSETAMAHINGHLDPGLETLFLPASLDRTDVSASMVRQLAQFGADISAYVPSQVLPDILAAFTPS